MTIPDLGQQHHQAVAATDGDGVKAFIGELWRFSPTDNESPQQRSRKRAALASLRRGLGKAPAEATEVYPYIIPILPEHISGWREEAFYLVAELFALYRPERGAPADRNFGVTYRHLAADTKSDSVERRFLALLDAPRENLSDHLRHAIGQMATRPSKIPVDWYALLGDILRWDAEGRYVQQRWVEGRWIQQKWARGFYASDSPAETRTSRQGNGER